MCTSKLGFKPHYKKQDKLPFIPTEQEVDALIAGNRKKTACMLQLLKETGMRVGEAWNLRWKDIDYEKNSVKEISLNTQPFTESTLTYRITAKMRNTATITLRTRRRTPLVSKVGSVPDICNPTACNCKASDKEDTHKLDGCATAHLRFV
jgi:integrase